VTKKGDSHHFGGAGVGAVWPPPAVKKVAKKSAFAAAGGAGGER